jgi:hypothetical protein
VSCSAKATQINRAVGLTGRAAAASSATATLARLVEFSGTAVVSNSARALLTVTESAGHVALIIEVALLRPSQATLLANMRLALLAQAGSALTEHELEASLG